MAATDTKQRQRVAETLVRLEEAYPRATTALSFSSPLELLIATILSAQCTDQRVNQVTAELFRKYRSVADYATAPLEALEKDIQSTGFYRNKAKAIQGCCRVLQEKHRGRVPKEIDQLVELPGIGRKTANVVLGTAHGVALGVAVDTHVARVSRRLGLSREKVPERIERDLMAVIPQDRWIEFSHQMIHHGRRICTARKPKCSTCPLDSLCPKVGVTQSA